MIRLIKLGIVVSIVLGAYYLFIILGVPPQDSSESENRFEQENVIEQTQSKVTYFTNLNDGVYLAIFPADFQLQLLNLSSLENIPEIADMLQDSMVQVLMNAGYFLEDNSHAGLLYIDYDNKEIVPLAYGDGQLTHVVNISTEKKPSVLTHDQYLQLTDDLKVSNIYFQAGPLIIENNVIQSDYITNSLNGNGAYRRSVLGILDTGEFFFLSTSKSYSLNDLAEYLLNLDLFDSKNLTVVNLDGGSSVAIASKENENFGLGKTKKLPFLLGAYPKE
jgi:uncharacterized protein YigE (DUF2233 family)